MYKDYEIVSEEFAKETGKSVGDVISIEEEHAHPLVVDRKIAPKGGDHAEEDGHETVEDDKCYTKSVEVEAKPAFDGETFKVGIEDTIRKSVEKALSGVSTNNTNRKSITMNNKIPAQVAAPPIDSLGELMRAMALSKKGHGASREALIRHEKNAIKEMNIKAAPLGAYEFGSGGPESGGYSVFPKWIDSIFQARAEYPRLLEMTEIFPCDGSSTINIPTLNQPSLADGSRHGGVLGYWQSAEGATLSSSFPSLLNKQLVLKSLFILTYVSLQLLDDSTVGFMNYTSKNSALELLWKIDQAILSGAGGAEPLGILNQPSLITISPVGGQAQTFNFENLVKMWSALWPPSRGYAVWLVNPQEYIGLMKMAFPNESGTFPAMSLQYDVRDPIAPLRLQGRPVIECLMLPDAGLEGSVILADMRQLYSAVHTPLVRIAYSDQFQFNTAQMAYRWDVRMDVNSPWNTTIASYDKTCVHYSPFVTLGATTSSICNS